jgi:hypothetical protein
MWAPCSAESAESTSASSEPECALSGKSSATHTPAPFCASTGPMPSSTTTSAPSERQTSLPLISSAADSPARTSATPASEWASTANARASGPSTPESFASFDRATSSWRTSQRSLLGGWSEWSETWPRAGMTRNGTAFRRRPLVPLTDEIGFSSLPTPNTQRQVVSGKAGRETAKGNWQGIVGLLERWPTPTVGDSKNAANATANRRPGSKHHPGETLVDAVRLRWPTPTSRDWKDGTATSCANVPENGLLGRAVHFRTPCARDGTARGPSLPERRIEQGHSVSLHDQIGGMLNPTWVEWLMGFPLGWTALDASETPSSRKSRNGSAGKSSRTRRKP